MIILPIKNIILIVIIIILGIIVSYSDIKNQIIQNKYIFTAMFLGLVLNLNNSAYEFRVSYLLNLVFAFFVGFLLWYINFWNAGDGKLYMTFVSLMPIDLVFSGIRSLYSYNLIVYTFVPIFFVFLLLLILQSTTKDIATSLKRTFRLKPIMGIAIAFFAFQWVIKIVNQQFGLRMNLFIGAVILFLFFNFIEKVTRLKLLNTFIIVAIVRIIIDFSEVIEPSFLILFVFQLLIFIFFIYFFLTLAYFKFGVHVKIPDLKPGMNLCEKIIPKTTEGSKILKYSVESDVKISLFTFLYDKKDPKALIELRPEGLTKKEINKIKELNRDNKLDVGSLLIQKRIPFAPFVFIGTIITLIMVIIQL